MTRISWSSAESRWTVDIESGAERKRMSCDFLQMCSGYYDYDDGYSNSHDNSKAIAAFGITTLVSAAVGTVGLVLAVTNEKTKITQTAGDSAKSANVLAMPKVAANAPDREPTWLNLRPAGVSAAPSATLFQMNF